MRFDAEPLFYWVVALNCSENSLVLFVRFFGFGALFQKCPDVHKIVLSIKSRSLPPPPPEKSVNFEDFVLICTVFPHFGTFSGGER